MEWRIADSEIQAVEHLLLPEGCHFADDALAVIRHWNSVDVSACPGSGKTTVLLAKLKLLADRMPLENGAGVCILSHTNVAVNEIKSKLAGYANKLMSYPNYIGTIQSFIDRFVVIPYIKNRFGRTAQLLDDRTYAQHLLYKMKCGPYKALASAVEFSYENCKDRYIDSVEHAMALYENGDGALCMRGHKKVLAGKDRPSAQQFRKLVVDLLRDEGVMCYQSAFTYANSAIEELSDQYTDLFCKRFQYVYVDEYQDCNEMQRNALRKLFDPTKCAVTHIGDPDQAIYNSDKDSTVDWCPSEGYLSIASSCRYNQKIANVLSPLRKDKSVIASSLERDGFKPVLIIYDMDTIGNVLGKFVSILEDRELHDSDGIYKAIGFIRKEDTAGIKIGSYWEEFDGTKQRSENKYWGIIDEICTQLKQGKLYKAEALIRKLICRLFHYAGISNAKTGKEHTPLSIRVLLKEKCDGLYSECVLGLVRLDNYSRDFVDQEIRSMVNALLITTLPSGKSIFDLVPAHFMEESRKPQRNIGDKNVFIEPVRGRRIQFDTVHDVKGETHDATLYLETEKSNGSDIGRVLHCYGVGKGQSSPIYDYSRKIVYVGMSRPRKLLCLAIKGTTYEKGKDAFLAWDKVDLRDN